MSGGGGGGFQTKTDMLDNLLDIEIAYSLLKGGGESTGDPLDVHYDKLKTDIKVSWRPLVALTTDAALLTATGRGGERLFWEKTMCCYMPNVVLVKRVFAVKCQIYLHKHWVEIFVWHY